MHAVHDRVFGFEGFTLDVRRRVLRTLDHDVELRPKSFDVLCCLVERAGQLVTKDEIFRAVWPGLNVSDDSLTRCVSDIRLSLGDREQRIVKTIPGRGYILAVAIARLVPDAAPADAASEESEPTALTLPDRPSIAVLPFDNMSGDPEQEYFADGIVEDIITELSRFGGLFVIARNSSFQWKGKAADVRRVARDLGVRYVLEGSVRKAGDHMRVSAQLIEAESGSHLWAEHYDRSVTDVFAVQDEVACTVAAILAAHVTKAEAERTLLKPPASWQAYDYYLRAAEIYATFHRPMQVGAIYQTRRLLEQCLAIDPGYARAHVLYSSTQISTYALPLDSDHLNPSVLERAQQSAERAVQLDPNLPRAHAQLAFVLSRRGMPEAAVAEFERAIALNPNFTDYRYAAVLTFAGQAERAIDVAKAYLRVDPFALPIARGYLGLAYLVLRRYAEAVPPLREFVSQSPNHRPARDWLTAAYGHLGQLEDARAQAAQILRLDPQFIAARTFRRASAFWRPEDAENVVDGLRKAGLKVA